MKKRFLSTIVGLSLCAWGFLAPPMAHALETESITDFLGLNEVPYIQGQYQPLELVFPVPPEEDFEVEISVPAPEFPYESGQTYSFPLDQEQETEGLIINLRLSASDQFKFEVFAPDGTTQTNFQSSSIIVEDPSMGVYSFRLDSVHPISYSLTVKTAEWVLPYQDYPDALLLAGPEETFSDSQWQTVQDFLEKEGHLLVVSNDFVGEYYDLYFYDYTLSRTLTTKEIVMGLGPFHGETLEIIENAAPLDNCTELSYLHIEEGSILKTFYCLNASSRPYRITFASEDLFELKTVGTEDLRNLIVDILQPLTPFTVGKPEVEETTGGGLDLFSLSLKSYAIPLLTLLNAFLLFSFFSLLFPRIAFGLLHVFGVDVRTEDRTCWSGHVVAHLRGLRRFAQHSPIMAFLGFYVFVFLLWELGSFVLSFATRFQLLLGATIFLGLSVAFFYWIFPEDLKRYFKFFSEQKLVIRSRLSRSQKVTSFLAFIFISTLFLYDFFFIHHWTPWVFLAAFLLGLFNFCCFESEKFIFTRLEQLSLYVASGLILALPFALVVQLMLPQFFALESQELYEMHAYDANTTTMELIGSGGSNLNGYAWEAAGGYLFVPSHPVSSFYVYWKPSKDILSRGTLSIDFKALLKGNGRISISPTQSLLNLFVFNENRLAMVPDAKNLVRVHSLGNIHFYRKKSSAIFSIDPLDSWQDIVLNHFPDNSSIGLSIPGESSDLSVFSRDDYEGLNEGESLQSISTNLVVPDDPFYTYLVDGLRLEMRMINYDSEYHSGTFTLRNADGETVHEIPFEVSANEWEGETFLFEHSSLSEGIYAFSFDFDLEEGEEYCKGCSDIFIKQISLNSPKLVLNSSYLRSQGADVLYFRYVGVPLYYRSPNGQSFMELEGGLRGLSGVLSSLAELTYAGDQLYKIYLPSQIDGELYTMEDSSNVMFYSFTEDSWFNPYRFTFTPINETNDFVIAEHEEPFYSLEGEQGWTWVERHFDWNVLDSEGVFFKFEFEEPSPSHFIILDAIEINVN